MLKKMMTALDWNKIAINFGSYQNCEISKYLIEVQIEGNSKIRIYVYTQTTVYFQQPNFLPDYSNLRKFPSVDYYSTLEHGPHSYQDFVLMPEG